jgi:hypothetical protein
MPSLSLAALAPRYAVFQTRGSDLEAQPIRLGFARVADVDPDLEDDRLVYSYAHADAESVILALLRETYANSDEHDSLTAWRPEAGDHFPPGTWCVDVTATFGRHTKYILQPA